MWRTGNRGGEGKEGRGVSGEKETKEEKEGATKGRGNDQKAMILITSRFFIKNL